MHKTMAQLRKAHMGYFFSKDTMAFFKSRVESKLYNGTYFITSEQFEDEAREFTVRKWIDNADIETVGERHASLDDAKNAINELI